MIGRLLDRLVELLPLRIRWAAPADYPRCPLCAYRHPPRALAVVPGRRPR